MKKIKIEENELFWGGSNLNGVKMPFDAETNEEFDLLRNAPNETMPFLVSSKGRVIWSDDVFSFSVKNGEISAEGPCKIVVETLGCDLPTAFRAARKKYFPINGRKLNRDFFKTAQYNTWIECLYHPTQEHVLKYAQQIIDNGFEPGILMIDEGWHGRYGNWEFDKLSFPDPKKMVDQLHKMGFKVMLWIVPFVCPDGEFFANTLFSSNEQQPPIPPEKRVFIRLEQPDSWKTALFFWWNGFSAALNLKNEADRKFLGKQLEHLMNDYGIDGFKFDGGKSSSYKNCQNGKPLTDLTPTQLNQAWNEFGTSYEYHEFKDTTCGAKFASIQRLADRKHTWDGQGLSSIIPDSIAQGLIGHPFICPDMVGGGDWVDFKPGKEIDQELFVRWAQCSALFPMMQYSKGPWTCLDEKHCKLVIEAGKLHKSLCEEIIDMVSRAENSGEPILRNLEYNYPNMGYGKINDEFMLEDKILAAPVIKKGATKRKVILPPGEWISDENKVYAGGEYEMDCPLERLIWFRKM